MTDIKSHPQYKQNYSTNKDKDLHTIVIGDFLKVNEQFGIMNTMLID